MQQEKDSLHSTHSKNSKQSAHSTRSAQSAHSKNTVHSENTVRSAQSAHSKNTAHSENTVRSAQSAHAKSTAHSENTVRSAQSAHAKNTARSKQSVQSKKTARSKQSVQSKQSAQSAHSENAAQSAHSEDRRKKTQTTQTTEIDYVKAPIPKVYRRLLPSAIGSLLTATVASFIDVVILSHYLGPGMLAIVSLCMPIYMLVNTLSMLIASGASTLYAQYLGEGDKQEALRYFSVSVVHSLICGVVLTVVGLLFTDKVVWLLGANDAVAAQTAEYAHVLFFFMIPLMIYVLLLFFVRIDNDPTRVLAATSVCAGVNLVLDILFVGPLHLGVKGAAMATCLAYTLGMFVNLTHFISRKNTLKFIQRCLKGRSLRVWRIGLPLAASQLGMTVSTQIFNNTVIRVGSEDYVAVYGVVIQLTMISMAIYEGVGQASQPMLAAAYGAGRWKRIRRVFLYGLRLELIGTVALALFYFLAANPVAGLFSIKEGALMDLALTAIRIYALSLPMTGVNSIIMYYFQAQEKTGRALLISLLYSSVLLIAALMILVALFREKAIWGSYPAAQAVALVISRLMLRRNQNERRTHK